MNLNLPSMLLDTLLPNRAWNRRVKYSGKHRLAYWALRLGLAILAVYLMVHHGGSPDTNSPPADLTSRPCPDGYADRPARP